MKSGKQIFRDFRVHARELVLTALGKLLSCAIRPGSDHYLNVLRYAYYGKRRSWRPRRNLIADRGRVSPKEKVARSAQ
jgi:hypothetical protein